jgi:hypothetical protein
MTPEKVKATKIVAMIKRVWEKLYSFNLWMIGTPMQFVPACASKRASTSEEVA